MTGVYSGTNQYSLGDYFSTSVAFIGLGGPNFLIAVVIMWVALSAFGLRPST